MNWRRPENLSPLPLLAAAEKAVEKPAPEIPVREIPVKVAETARDDWRWLEDNIIAGNELWRVLSFVGAIAVAVILGRVARRVLVAAARRFEARGQHMIAVTLTALTRPTLLVAVVLGLKTGFEFVTLTPLVESIVDSTMGVLVTITVGYIAYCLVSVVDEWIRLVANQTTSKLDVMMVPLVRTCLQVTIWLLVLVQIATLLSDKPMTSVLAGLGVGGLAIGLAAQDTIKNFFGSMMIFSDRPFELGDEIIVDAFRGSVENVGFRSTRFRTGDGYLVTMPNGELANKTIVNVSKRPNLMRSLNLPLSYDLSPDKVKRATAIVGEILTDHEGLRANLPPRIYFNDFTPSAMNLQVMYWYHPPDWWSFVAFNQRVNLEITQRFAAEEIRLAYPTQTVRLVTEEKEESAERGVRNAE